MNNEEVLPQIPKQPVKYSNIIKFQITMSLLLILAPAFSIESKGNNYKKQEISQWIAPEDININDEERESTNSYEAIVKEGIRRTLTTVNSLTDIPSGGKKIDYYRLEWSQK